MPKKLNPKRNRKELREEALRPSPYLGYDRDAVAVYLIDREVYDIAESQLRRAIWLNPMEPKFKEHLAWCLYKQERYAEAKQWVEQALAQQPESQEGQRIRKFIEEALNR